MAIGDEPLSLLSNLLALHWLCDFRNNHRVRRRRLPSPHAQCVCKLDRLARSTRDLLNTLDVIGKAGATFKSLADAWANTDTAHGRLMLAVLGGLAEFERHPNLVEKRRR